MLLEDLAAEFKMLSKDVVSQIDELEQSGRLTGITDDKGKYIHITNEEFDRIAAYLKTKGRINRVQLLQEANRIIRMVPTAEDREKIKAENQELLQNVERGLIKEE